MGDDRLDRWSVWRADAFLEAACALCGRPRGELASRMVDGEAGHVCEECLAMAAGVVATMDEPAAVAGRILDGIFESLVPASSKEQLTPLLEAMVALARSSDAAERAFRAACRSGHDEIALAALARIPPAERSPFVRHELAALSRRLGRIPAQQDER